MSETKAADATTVVTPKEVSISGIIGMLEAGKTREEIRLEFGISKAQLARLFALPKLKGRKTHAALPFAVIDDAPNVVPIVTKPKGPKAPKAEGASAPVAETASAATTVAAPAAEAISSDKGSW